MMNVTRDNWYSMAIILIDRLKTAADAAAPNSLEEKTLLIEVWRIEEMMKAVNEPDPNVRGELRSHLLGVLVRDPLQVSDELIEFDGAVADVYRRWRRVLQPIT